jgi:hypothetical protein
VLIRKVVAYFLHYVSYTNRYLQAEKKATARSSTFHFARTSQNKKSLPFPTTTHK